MSSFDIIEDVEKVLPKTGKLGKMKPFIIGGAGLGLVYLLFVKGNNNNTDGTLAADNSGVMTGDDLSGIMSDFASQGVDELSASNDTIISQLMDNITAQNDKISAVQDEFNSKYDGLISSQVGSSIVNEMPLNNIVDYGNDGVGYTPLNVAANLKALFSDNTAMTAEMKRVEDVISNRQLAGMDISKQLTYKNTLVNTSGVGGAGFGDNGAGYTTASGKALTQKLNTDSTFKASEVARTNEVIANRKAAGLDISLQTKYLNTLN